jgi:hypothetical protein
MVGIATTGPTGTLATVIAGTSGLVIGSNSNRNGLIFCNGSTTATAWLVPVPLVAAVGFGIPIFPQSTSDDLLMPKHLLLGLASGWNGIADTGPINLLVLEFFGQ